MGSWHKWDTSYWQLSSLAAVIVNYHDQYGWKNVSRYAFLHFGHVDRGVQDTWQWSSLSEIVVLVLNERNIFQAKNSWFGNICITVNFSLTKIFKNLKENKNEFYIRWKPSENLGSLRNDLIMFLSRGRISEGRRGIPQICLDPRELGYSTPFCLLLRKR